MKKYIIIFLILIFYSMLIAGSFDDFDELEKKLDDKMSAIEEKYEEKSRKLDEIFVNTLKDDWFNVKFKKGKKPYKKPKPVEIPKAPPTPKPEIDNTPPVVIPKPKPTPVEETPKPVPVVIPKKDEFEVKVDFFGQEVIVSLPKGVRNIPPVKMNNRSIAEYWDNVSVLPHESTFKQLKSYYDSIFFNDWAYLMFLEMLCEEIYPRRNNIQKLYSWFLLIKTGYQARVGYDKQKVYLLLPVTTMVYGHTYFIFDNTKFYKISATKKDNKRGSIYTYKGKYPGANKKMNLKIRKWPKMEKELKKRDLSFKYNRKRYKVPVQYQREIVRFVKNYPQTTIDAYAGAPLSGQSQKSLNDKLRILVQGKKETEAVNILLAFIQKSFDYKTDQQQFGYEKWFFAEETLYYDYSDCEDRSVIFARLVTDLLGLKVVLLNYPGHMAAAVRFSKNVQGDKVKHNNVVYTVCDPTYIGASYGRAMPQFKNVKPKVTEF